MPQEPPKEPRGLAGRLLAEVHQFRAIVEDCAPDIAAILFDGSD
jgi:hypothetical protein